MGTKRTPSQRQLIRPSCCLSPMLHLLHLFSINNSLIFLFFLLVSYGPSKQWAEGKRGTVNKFYSVTKSVHIKGNYLEAMPVLNKLLLFRCFYKEKRRKKQEQWKNGNCSITPFNNKYSQAVLLTKEGGKGFIFAFFWCPSERQGHKESSWVSWLSSLPAVFPGFVGRAANPGAEEAPWAHLGSPGGLQIQSSAFGRRKVLPSWWIPLRSSSTP